MAKEKHKPIYEDLIKMYQVEYIPGGSTQNSIKVAQVSKLYLNYCSVF